MTQNRIIELAGPVERRYNPYGSLSRPVALRPELRIVTVRGRETATCEIPDSTFIVLWKHLEQLAIDSAGQDSQASWLKNYLISRQTDPTRSDPELLPIPVILSSA